VNLKLPMPSFVYGEFQNLLPKCKVTEAAGDLPVPLALGSTSFPISSWLEDNLLSFHGGGCLRAENSYPGTPPLVIAKLVYKPGSLTPQRHYVWFCSSLWS
jgi:hypothetical protein